MPLFYQHNINGNTRLAIWQIAEPESFFLDKVPLKRDVSHPHKRLQHLAGRYLLPALFEDFPLQEIVIADTRKPYLENERYHFSISHCGDFAAAIVSRTSRVGIDIEMMTPKITLIRHKFLSEQEWSLAEAQQQELPAAGMPEGAAMQTLLWSAKESVFKWYSLGGVNFREHIVLAQQSRIAEDEWRMDFLFSKSGDIHLEVQAKIFGRLVLAWVLTER